MHVHHQGDRVGDGDDVDDRVEDGVNVNDDNNSNNSKQGRMMKKGSMMVSYQPLGRIPNFFRSIISNQVIIIIIIIIFIIIILIIIIIIAVIIMMMRRLKPRRTLTSCWKRSTLLVATCNAKVPLTAHEADDADDYAADADKVTSN